LERLPLFFFYVIKWFYVLNNRCLYAFAGYVNVFGPFEELACCCDYDGIAPAGACGIDTADVRSSLALLSESRRCGEG